jgi:hypothetical protein
MGVNSEIDTPAALILGKNVGQETIATSFSDPIVVSTQMFPEHLQEEHDPVVIPKY